MMKDVASQLGDEGRCKSVSFETEDVAVVAVDAQLPEFLYELTGPIKEAKILGLSKILVPLVNVTHFQYLVLQN